VNTDIVPYGGWDKNLRLHNDTAEAIVSLEVGPRILSYRTHGGENVLKNYPEQLGKSGESDWMIRGGHRLWLAPEDEVHSYHRDNFPVEHVVAPDGEVVIESLQGGTLPLRKTLGLMLDDSGPRLALRHSITNEGNVPIQAATWALTVMVPEGLEIIPQPPLGEHPRDLLPNRGLVLWPYTDMSDTRLFFGRKFFTLRQTPSGGPTKFGLAHRAGWIGYVVGTAVFIKAFDHTIGATYPDGGCNFETFTNPEMLEMESLGPLRTLAPGETTTHLERWWIFDSNDPVEIGSEEALANWIGGFLEKTGLPRP